MLHINRKDGKISGNDLPEAVNDRILSFVYLSNILRRLEKFCSIYG